MDRDAAPATLPFPSNDVLAVYSVRFDIRRPGVYEWEARMLTEAQASRSVRTPVYDEATGCWWVLRLVHAESGEEAPLMAPAIDGGRLAQSRP